MKFISDAEKCRYFSAKFLFSEKRVAPGTFVNVKIEEMLDYDVIGSVVEDNA